MVVANNMFFPYITGKNILFRVLVEVAFFLYLALAWKDASIRPKKNALLVAFSSFVGVILISDIFSPSFLKAFWSNFERMEGFVTLAHLFVYFVVLSSFLKEKKDWILMFYSSLAVAVGLSWFGYFELTLSNARVDSTIGNAAYFATYLLFHIFFLLFISVSKGLQTRGLTDSIVVGSSGFVLWYMYHVADPNISSTKGGVALCLFALVIAIILAILRYVTKFDSRKLAGFLYVALSLALTLLLYFTATRGSTLGLLGGIFISGLYLAWHERKNVRIRNASVAVLAIMVVLVGLFVSLRNTDFVQNNRILVRFATISWSENKTQARGYIWPMAIEGVKEKPLLGWGQEGFSYVFAKYYNPRLITHEPWFDRAHNVFLDWMIAGGILGFLGYLSLYIIFAFYTWRSKSFSCLEKSVLLGLIGAYAFQNLFIFDNITSSILFIIILGFVSALSDDAPPILKDKTKVKDSGQVLAIAIVCMFVCVYLLNAPVYFQNRNLLKALSYQGGDLSSFLGLFKKAIHGHYTGSFESREHFMRLSSDINSNQEITPEVKKIVTDAVIEENKSAIENSVIDTRSYYIFGRYFMSVGLFDEALASLLKAVAGSPQKQQILNDTGTAYLLKGEADEAMKYFDKAYNLSPDVDESKYVYMGALFEKKDMKAGIKMMYEIKDLNLLVDERIIKILFDTGHSKDAETVLKKAIDQNKDNVKAYVVLANLYKSNKDNKSAIKILNDLKILKPEYSDDLQKEIDVLSK